MLTQIVAAAVEEEEHGELFSPVVPVWEELVWAAIFFGLLLLLMTKYVLPRLKRTLDARAAAVTGQVTEAQAVRADADRVLADYRARLADAQAESQRIIDEGRRTGEQIVADARARAEAEAQAIVSRAQADIAGERDRAITALRAELGTLSIELASRVVGRSLDSASQRALVDSYIDELATSAR